MNDKKEKIIRAYISLSLVSEIIGYSLLWYSTNWMVVLALVIIRFGENLKRRSDKLFEDLGIKY